MAFGKETDYMDYTLLKKKGMLKIKEQKIDRLKTDEGFVDFTGLASKENSEMPSPDVPSAPAPSPNMDFLSSLASGSSPISPPSSLGDSSDVNSLKIKIDDMEYKLDQFIERIDRLEEQLSRLGQE